MPATPSPRLASRPHHDTRGALLPRTRAIGRVSVARLALAIGAAAFIGACEPDPGEPSAGPPPDARFVADEATPDSVMGEYLAAKKADREAVAASYVGLWVPASGWEGEATALTKEDGGTAVRMYFHDSRIIGGGYWVVAIVPGWCDVQKGTLARVQGRIRAIEELPGAPAPTYRIVLEECLVVERR